MKKTFQAMKRVLSLIMVLAMLVSFMPPVAVNAVTMSGGEQLYLKPNSNWVQANARFAMYVFNNSTNTNQWVDMKDSNGDGVYEVTVPSGSWTNVIFCRMNPGAATNDWSNKWNQTGDLVYDGTKDMYAMNAGSWDQGAWGTYVYEEAYYTIAGTISSAGWSPENGERLRDEDADGIYVYTYTNVAAGSYEFKVTNGTWDAAWPSANYALTVADDGSDVTVTFNAISKTVSVEVVKEYSVTFSGTNVTNDGAAKIVKGETYTATLTAAEGYALPEAVTVTVGGEAVTPNYDSTTGELTVNNVTGDVVITAVGKKIPAVYNVTFNGTNVTSNGAATVTEGEAYTNTLTAAEGYTLPETVTVTVGGVKIDTFTFAEGVLTIPAASVTGDITITAEGVEEETGYTVYCINSARWNQVSAYAWTDGGAALSWPGVAMTKTGETVNGFDVYSITFETVYSNIIFNNNNNGSQTSDLTLEVGKYYDVKTGAWYASLADVPEIDQLATDAYLAGEFNGWNTTVNVFRLNEAGAQTGFLALELEANTTYEFKVVNSGAWLGNNGTITDSVSGWVFDSDANAKIVTGIAGTYVFAFDTAANKLSVTYPAALAVYEVTLDGINVNITGENTVTEGNGYTATLTAAEGFDLPAAVTVKVGGAELIGGYTYENGVLTIEASVITGDITITAEGVEQLPTTMTIYFQNNWLWTDVSIYYWGSTTGENPQWHGNPMVVVDNDGTYDIYSAEIPGDVTGMIINGIKDDGSGNRDKTPDITEIESGNKCYYMMWESGNQAKTFDYTPPASEYAVTFNGTNVTSNGAATVTEGSDYTATLTAEEGYTLPETITVTVGGIAMDAYTYEDGVLTIPAASIIGDVVITAEGTEISTGTDMITVYFRNDWLWTNVSVHYFGSAAVADTTWPGMKMDKVDNDGTYDIYAAEIPADVEGIVFTGNKDTDPNALDQSPDIKTDITDGSAYYMHWDGENKCSKFDYTPSGGEGGEDTSTEYTVTFHFANNLGWSNVNLYTWIGSGTALTGSWPGTAVNPDASGYYTATVTYEAETNNGLNFIFNNGSVQTIDLTVPASDFVDNKAEKWVVLTTQTNGKYNANITNSPEGIVTSPVVDGSSVTFNYGDNTAASVSVAGSFNGWSATANPMTKGEDGVWTVTVDGLAAGDYQYKFVINGENWVLDPMNSNTVTDSDGNQNSLFSILHDQSAEDDNKVTVRVHYTRTDGNYDGWNLWVWGSNMGGHQVDFETTDENGAKVATIVLEDARAHQNISFKERLSVDGNDWKDQGSSDRSIDLSTVVSGTIDYYIPEGNCVYGEDVIRKNKISSVELDYDNNAIIVTSVQAIADPEGALKLVKGEEEIPVTVTAIGSKYTLTLAEDTQLDLSQLYRYKVDHYGDLYAIAMDAAYASDKFAAEYTYTGTDLGANYTSDGTTFRVWAPTAEEVSVKLYTTGSDFESGASEMDSYTMTKDVNGTWVVYVDGDLEGVYYTYEVNVNGETVEACDPYARTTGVNGQRAMVIDLDSTDPSGWSNDKNPNPVTSQTDAIIYELHVRDFSIDGSSGVKEAWRGKYLAFTQKGTTTAGGAKTGIDYLKSLGFTHLHLLPVYDFGSVNETTSNKFNWGYDPVNYNVPEGSYATDPYDGNVRVNEFKQMVKALHDADISVVMDVVYNHVYDADKFCFNQIVPGYFSRVSSNASGCGNDTASEREMVRKYIVESVLYWTEEYHIDGFRFDLVGLLDVETINQIVTEVHKIRPDVIFYGEGWDMDGTNKEPGTQMAKQGNASKTPGFAYFSDSMRNGLGGDNSGNATGFASGAGNGGAMVTEWLANPWWSSNPQQVVQYASCHDNYTLADKLILSTGRSKIDATVIKMNNLAAAFYMTAQGVPFIHAGEEILREKINPDGSRNHNSYNSSDEVNHIQWSNLDKADYAANAEYYKGLIAFRKAHPALSLSSTTAVKNNVYVQESSDKLVSFWIDGREVSGEDYDSIYVIFNADSAAKTVTLPEGDWDVCVNGIKAGTAVIETVSGSVSVEGISAMVLVQKESTQEPSQRPQSNVALPGSFNEWNQGSMMEIAEEENTYTKTLSLPVGTYEFKIKIENDWYGNSGTIVDTTDTTSETGWDMSTGEGSNCKLEASGGAYTFIFNTSTNKLIIKHDPDGGEFADPDAYYLCGWINGASHGEGVAISDYKFENGKLTATFASDTYVCVKKGDNSATYMTQGWLGNVTSATLYDTAKHELTADKWDKMVIPTGVEVTFTLVIHDDNTVTLSYEIAQDESVVDTSGIQNGVTLHCWNWSFKQIEENMPLIADMGFTAIQTSPIQPLKEATTDATDTVGDVWWVYYQPVDFKITDGNGNALGTKEDLQSMIATAHEYGIQVIVDVVANHLGNKTGNDLADAIPEYLRKDDYWHDITVNTSNYDNREDVTQHCMGGLPDLNTDNDEIQGYVLDFLKTCVDIGVDGFRFDAAKHIETPKDNADFASDFWPTVVGGAESYAKEKYNKDLYIYGELLDEIKGLSLSAYTQYMAITDNSWGNSLRNAVASGNAALKAGYDKAVGANVLVLWAESHDTYMTGDEGQTSYGVSEKDINKTWALVAARADAMGLYLARPESIDQLLGVASKTGWDNEEVEAVNEFHNAFVGQAEAIGNENGISYVVRGTTGAVLVNISGDSDISVDALGMADGTYTDQITGSTFTVAEGKISGTIGSTGIAVVYNVTKYDVNISEVTGGTVTADKETAQEGETVTVTVTADAGKQIDQITAVDAAGQSVSITDNGDGTYSFTQPASAVIVTVTFKDKAPDVPVKNQITVSDAASGTVEISNETPETDDIVTITPVPDEGVMVEKVTVTDASGKEVPVTANEDGTYSFTQPEGDVTVTVVFKPDYKIVAGNGSSAEHGSDETLTFKANGAFEKFVSIKVDGKAVDAANYTAKAGSTIVTLKASFLKTLAAGEHSIAILFTDDQAEGTFSLKVEETVPPTTEDDETVPPTTEDDETVPPTTEDDETVPPTTEDDETVPPTTEDDETVPPTTEEDKNDTPPTGDEAQIMLWSAMMLVSTMACAALILGRKKGKYAK